MNPLDLKNMFKQAQEMQGKMGELQAELATKRFEASSGGGMVTAVATGDLKIVDIRIEESVFGQGDRSLIEDLIAAAVNAALATAQQHVQSHMQQQIQGLGIPGLGGPPQDGGS
ncbi:MAG: YbaB/EbfC family nucleoid-associated protein [bacterium]|jgi:DNA-binding YbaB/EbfC family protein|nr:YbaB/EbfC family nucleoid-associated protein [Myxococcota bacterium]